jgi:hypothetical protein
MALLYKIRTEGEFTVYTLPSSRTWLFIALIVLWFAFLGLGYYQILPNTFTTSLIFLDSLTLGIFAWELRILSWAQASASSQKKINGKGFTEVWLGPKA